MFTLKFLSLDTSTEPARPITTVVGAVRYDVLEYTDGNYSIATYDKSTSQDEGTEFRVSNNKMDYATCYIENSAGKTIACYRSVAGDPESVPPEHEVTSK